jgi:hypothetical protein
MSIVLLFSLLRSLRQVISYHSIPVDVLSFSFVLANAFAVLMVGLLCRADSDDSDLNRAAMIAVGVSVVRNKREHKMTH